VNATRHVGTELKRPIAAVRQAKALVAFAEAVLAR
jgi:hypothetical protein